MMKQTDRTPLRDSSEMKNTNEENFQNKLDNSFSDGGIDHYFDLDFSDL